MRLDLFLKASRLIPRRSLAQEYCDKNLIRVNGISAKSSKGLAVGDEIEIKRRDKRVVVRIVAIPATKQVSRDAASGLYSVVSETPGNEETF
jgi:ribosomal 50S subunit-recycling heat shock protein